MFHDIFLPVLKCNSMRLHACGYYSISITGKASISFVIQDNKVTVQPSTFPRGAALHSQGNPKAATRQTAVCAVCVHTFVAMKPKG